MSKYEILYVLVKDRYRFDKKLLVETGEFEGRDVVETDTIEVSESDWTGEFVGKTLYDIVRKHVSNEEEALSMVGNVFEIEQYEDRYEKFVPNGEEYLKDVDILAVYGLNIEVRKDGVVLVVPDASNTSRVLSDLRLEDTEYVVTFTAGEQELDMT